MFEDEHLLDTLCLLDYLEINVKIWVSKAWCIIFEVSSATQNKNYTALIYY